MSTTAGVTGGSSYAADLIDGLDVCCKRSAGTLGNTHQIGSFLEKLGTLRGEYAAKSLALLKIYGHKKLLANNTLDGTVRTAMEVVIVDLETVANHELIFAKQLQEISNRVRDFVHANEAKQKKLEADGKRVESNVFEQLGVFKRKRAHYLKVFQEVELSQQEFQKAQDSFTTNAQTQSRISTRASRAAALGTQAEQEYRDALQQTNDTQTEWYTKNMPQLLVAFQGLEEDRICFVQQTLKEYSHALLELSNTFKKAGCSSESSVLQIDSNTDVAGFVAANKTHVTVPPPLLYEAYTARCCEPPLVGCVEPYLPGTPKDTQEWGLSDSDESLPLHDRRCKLTEQHNSIAKHIMYESHQVDRLEALLRCSGNDPISVQKAQLYLTESKQKLAAFKSALALVQSQLPALEAIDPPLKEPVSQAPASHICVRALSDYTASCPTELSFSAGDTFTVTDQGDPNGFWYATTHNNQAGFIPPKWVRVVTSPDCE
ncbi:hypothetical protein Pelo_6081 [Pelomyxa schiedti]|nr:hypothetical protein Pelo_6081 [Pelomyxa schiedti]